MYELRVVDVLTAIGDSLTRTRVDPDYRRPKRQQIAWEGMPPPASEGETALFLQRLMPLLDEDGYADFHYLVQRFTHTLWTDLRMDALVEEAVDMTYDPSVWAPADSVFSTSYSPFGDLEADQPAPLEGHTGAFANTLDHDDEHAPPDFTWFAEDDSDVEEGKHSSLTNFRFMSRVSVEAPTPSLTPL
jgi:hypothetical protein